jgi:Ni,Fe-hydrogenase III small subunit
MNGPDVLMPLERFGIRFVAAPRLARRAHVLVVTGTVRHNMRDVLDST